MTRGAGRVMGGVLLNIAALAGLVCIVLVLLGMVFNVSLIMFKTGSMTPTIPQGSLAVVRQIPAEQIDVVTVDRDGMLPVSHRVTSVTAGPEGADAAMRTITLKGDANAQEDPAPYDVSQVRIVMFSVPKLAYAVVWFSDPWVLGALTLGASALVTWAFWPKRGANPTDRRRAPKNDGASDATAADAGTTDAPEHDGPRHAARRSGSASALTVLALGGAGALLGGTLALAPGAAAHAAPTTTVTEGRYITMTTIGDAERMRSLPVGDRVAWQVGVKVDAPESGADAKAGADAVTGADAGTDSEAGTDGPANIDLSSSGDLILDAEVRACTERWQHGECPGSEVEVSSPARITGDQSNEPLLSMPVNGSRWLLFTLTRPADQSGSVDVTVRATASGDEVTSDGGNVGALPYTGTTPLLPVVLAIGAIGIGLLLAGLARARAAVRERSRS